MNCLEVRTWFVQESGRLDLVTDETTYADNGANRYLNAGIRELDRLSTVQKTMARWVDMVTAGTYVVQFQKFRAIKEVWIAISGIGRWRLEKKSLKELRELWPNMDTFENGQTQYYTPALLRMTPEFLTGDLLTFDAILAYIGDIATQDHFSYNGVLFLPPIDQAAMVEVIGYAYSRELSANTDANFWTVEHPEIVVMAGQMMLERFARNSEGVKDWKANIQDLLTQLEMDAVEEEISDIDEMEG